VALMHLNFYTKLGQKVFFIKIARNIWQYKIKAAAACSCHVENEAYVSRSRNNPQRQTTHSSYVTASCRIFLQINGLFLVVMISAF